MPFPEHEAAREVEQLGCDAFLSPSSPSLPLCDIECDLRGLVWGLCSVAGRVSPACRINEARPWAAMCGFLPCISSGQRRARLLRGAWHGWAVILESICFKQLSILLSSHLRRRSAVLLRYISKLCPVGDSLGAGWENRVWFRVCVRKSRPQGDLRRPHAGVVLVHG